jgi:hypothetical protein
VTVGEVATNALSIAMDRLGRQDQNRIMTVLKRAEWGRLKKDSKGTRWWARILDGGRL